MLRLFSKEDSYHDQYINHYIGVTPPKCILVCFVKYWTKQAEKYSLLEKVYSQFYRKRVIFDTQFSKYAIQNYI